MICTIIGNIKWFLREILVICHITLHVLRLILTILTVIYAMIVW